MEDIGAAVERILADPEFGRMVKELGGGESGDLTAKLPEVMETLGPIFGGVGKTGEERDPAKEAELQSAAPSSEGRGAGRVPYNRSNAEKLFLALRPYLGERRRGLVDRCVSVMKMGEILKAVGMTPGASGSAEAGRSGVET